MPDKVEIEDVMSHLEETLKREVFLTTSKSSVKKSVERTYNPEIIKRYYVSELIPNGDEFVVRLKKRFEELTDEEYKAEYWPKGEMGK